MEVSVRFVFDKDEGRGRRAIVGQHARAGVPCGLTGFREQCQESRRHIWWVTLKDVVVRRPWLDDELYRSRRSQGSEEIWVSCIVVSHGCFRAHRQGSSNSVCVSVSVSVHVCGLILTACEAKKENKRYLQCLLLVSRELDLSDLERRLAGPRSFFVSVAASHVKTRA